MWKSTVISILFLISPFLVCDPAPSVKSYILTDNGKLIGQIKAQPDGSLKYSVRKAKIGFHQLSITPCNEYYCDEIETFVFIRPKRLEGTFKLRLRPVLETDKFEFVDDTGSELYYKFLNPPPRKEK